MALDYYEILGVSKSATPEEIKKSFRRLAHKFHPDKKTGDEKKFKELNEAYQVLSNPQKRKQYDQFGPAFSPGAGGSSGAYSAGGFGNGPFGGFSGAGVDFEDLGDIFSDFFAGGRRTSRRVQRGSDIETDITIDFKESILGTTTRVELYKTISCDRCHGNKAEPGTKIDTCSTCQGSGQVMSVQSTFLGQMRTATVCPRCGGEGKTYVTPCSQCQGRGAVKGNRELKVKIPAGIEDEQTIRVQSEGEAAPGGVPGNLYLHVRVRPDSQFRREGRDVVSQVEISFAEAALGTSIKVDTLTGEGILKIPAGTQSHKRFRLKGRGVAGLGDQLVEVMVKTPTRLSAKQKKLFQELAESEKGKGRRFGLF